MACTESRLVISADESALGIVNSQIMLLTAQAQDAYQSAMTAIQALKDAAILIDALISVSISEPGLPPFTDLNLVAPVAPLLETIPIPAINVDYQDEQFQNALLDELNAILIEQVQDGGDSLSADAETAIFDQGVEKELQDIEDEKDALAREWAEQGFAVEDGLYTSGMAKIERLHLDRHLADSRKIEEQSEQVLIDNTRLAVELGGKLEGLLHDIFGKAQDRRLRAATEVIAEMVKVFDIFTATFDTLAEMYQTIGSIYDGEVSTMAEIDKARVKWHRADIEFALAQARLALKNAELTIKEANIQAMATAEAGADAAVLTSHLTAAILSAKHAQSAISFVAKNSGSTTNTASNSVSCIEREIIQE